MSEGYRHTFASMGTVVSIEIVGHSSRQQQREREKGVERASAWFRRIEEECSRFNPSSDVRRLSTHPGEPVKVTALLFRAVEFALAVARETEGAFDPTIGLAMEARGFDRDSRTGVAQPSPIDHDAAVSWRDVTLDPDQRTILLERPLVLDLGAVVKGLAVDMAALELMALENFAVDAGGDLYLGGHNADEQPWSVGIRHPRNHDELFETLHVSNTAVCTSGDYERRSGEHGHHILDPRTAKPVSAVASVAVVASSAMVADALGTAAFVLGPVAGIELLERHNVGGVIITPELERFATQSMTMST